MLNYLFNSLWTKEILYIKILNKNICALRDFNYNVNDIASKTICNKARGNSNITVRTSFQRGRDLNLVEVSTKLGAACL